MTETDSRSGAPPEPRTPLLGLAPTVLFPRDVATVELSRHANRRALEELERGRRLCVATPLLGEDVGEPTGADFQPVGTLARILGRTPLPGGGVRVVLQGLRRQRLERVRDRGGWFDARALRVERDPTPAAAGALEALRTRVEELAQAEPDFPGELAGMIPLYGEDVERITDLAATVLPLPYEERAQLLIETDAGRRLARLNRRLDAELVRLRARSSVDDRVAKRIRKDYLHKQLEALRSELAEPPAHVRELARLEARIGRVPLPEAARRLAQRQLRLLARALPASPEATRTRAHLEWMLELAWPVGKRGISKPRSFESVSRALAKSHVGLQDVKQRIAEFLAVRSLGGGARGTVLCFLGPPGTGKSSMGRTVAKALGRPFLTIPVGAMTLESELIGVPHRQQGAAPGAILAGLHRAGTNDPVILLDEIDKLSLGRGGHGRWPAAPAARPGAERRLPRPLPRRADRPLALSVPGHRQRLGRRSRGTARSHGGHRVQQLHGRREGDHRAPARAPQRPTPRGRVRQAVPRHPGGAARHHPGLHGRGGSTPAPASPHRPRTQGRRAGRERRRGADRAQGGARAAPRPAGGGRGAAAAGTGGRRGDGARLDRRRRSAAAHRGPGHAGVGADDPDRPARRRAPGVGADRDLVRAHLLSSGSS